MLKTCCRWKFRSGREERPFARLIRSEFSGGSKSRKYWRPGKYWQAVRRWVQWEKNDTGRQDGLTSEEQEVWRAKESLLKGNANIFQAKLARPLKR